MSAMRIIVILLILLGASEIADASKTRMEMPVKVEHPQIYELLVLQYNLLNELFPGWPRSASVGATSVDDVVIVTVRFLVPIDSSSINMYYSFRLLMRFERFLLSNEVSIREAAESFQQVLSHMEQHQAINLFRIVYKLDVAQLYWDRPSYGLIMHSPGGDTIVYNTYWPSKPRNEWFRMFRITEPRLLNRLEWFLSRNPFPQVTEFRNRVGIGYARWEKGNVFVSSGKGCTTSDACFLANHSSKHELAFKLPTSYDWPGFPFYSGAMKAVSQYLKEHEEIDCMVSHAVDTAFALMSFQPNRKARRIYIPIMCGGEKERLLSVNIGLDGSEDLLPIIHDLSVLDSLQIGCP